MAEIIDTSCGPSFTPHRVLYRFIWGELEAFDERDEEQIVTDPIGLSRLEFK
ncbi:MAG: hypothetical protein KF876_14765 [Nitrospira sp.]|nr:hypothetical protein [Nitrospira sp.]